MKKNLIVVLPVLGEANSIRFLFNSLKSFNVIVITSKSGGEKSKKILQEKETLDGLEVIRLSEHYSSFPSWKRGIEKHLERLENFECDIVLYGTWYLSRVGIHLKKRLGGQARLVCFTEFFSNSKRLIGYRRYYLGLSFLKVIFGTLLRLYLKTINDLIIVSDLDEEESERIKILPWCNHIFDLDDLKSLDERENSVIFAGSLTGITINCDFFKGVGRILENTGLTIRIIGDGVKMPEIKEFSMMYSGRVKLLGQVPREQAIDEISKSRFGILTTQEGGWGFIGECLAMGTPLLIINNHYQFRDRIDSYYLSDIFEDFSILEIAKERYESNSRLMRQRYLNQHDKKSVVKKIEVYLGEL